MLATAAIHSEGLYHGPHSEIDHYILTKPLLDELHNWDIQNFDRPEPTLEEIKLAESLRTV